MPTVAVSEYMRNYPEQIRKYVNGNYICLGTDGYGRSDTRENLREFFEIDQNYIVYYALILSERNIEAKKFARDQKLNLKKKNPWQI